MIQKISYTFISVYLFQLIFFYWWIIIPIAIINGFFSHTKKIAIISSISGISFAFHSIFKPPS